MNGDPDGNGKGALVHGGTSLGRAVALELAKAGVRIALYDPGRDSSQTRDEVQAAGGEAHVLNGTGAASDAAEAALVAEAVAALGRLDVLINVFVPDTNADLNRLAGYSVALMARCLAAAKAMTAAGVKEGAIVNHCPLPSMYAGTRLEGFMPIMKGSITGVNRSLCRTLGNDGIRANCVQSGLIEAPEFRAIASPEVLQVKVPLGRWGRVEDFAKLVCFLALKKTYITGQSIVLDGGLTAGITGT
jgi:NAD(P)-dependent dehydrogenase (short-subunit alcohol dehydrogenase family)